jgi:hypothetical protein
MRPFFISREATFFHTIFANWVLMGNLLGMLNAQNISISSGIFKPIAQIEESKSAWRASDVGANPIGFRLKPLFNRG